MHKRIMATQEPPKEMRNVFFDEVCTSLINGNDSIVILNADFGAAPFGRLLSNVSYKKHFISTGIAEQNLINLAHGLALKGKTPYAYAMTPFLFARPYEQTKLASAMNVPINIVGVGYGFGYKGDGPTHYAPEDVGLMRTLPNMEIVTPCDIPSTIATARHTISTRGLRYIRFDRESPAGQVYEDRDTRFIDNGLVELNRGSDIGLFAVGNMVHKAREAQAQLAAKGISAGVVDVYRSQPFNIKEFCEISSHYSRLATIEENYGSGGLGELIAGIIADEHIEPKKLTRFHIPHRYMLEGWTKRDDLHRLSGIDVPTIVAKLTA